MTELNLRALVREVIVSSTLDDNRAIAEETIRRLHADEIRAALEQSLPKFVAQVVSEIRSQVRFDFVPAPDAVLVDPTAADGRTGFAGSAKVRAIRDNWRLTLRLHKVATPDGQKKLADCTYDDLVFAAGVRHEMAMRNLSKEKQYRDLAETLKQYQADTVAALPSDVLRVAIGQVAA